MLSNTFNGFKKKAITIFILVILLVVPISLISRPSHDQDWDDIRELKHERLIEQEKNRVNGTDTGVRGSDIVWLFFYCFTGISFLLGTYFILRAGEKRESRSEFPKIKHGYSNQSSDYSLTTTKTDKYLV